MNNTTKWLVFGWVGAIVLGLAAWGWAGQDTTQAMPDAPMGSAPSFEPHGWRGGGMPHGMGMMGMHSGASSGFAEWCAKMWGQMQSGMNQIMGDL